MIWFKSITNRIWNSIYCKNSLKNHEINREHYETRFYHSRGNQKLWRNGDKIISFIKLKFITTLQIYLRLYTYLRSKSNQKYKIQGETETGKILIRIGENVLYREFPHISQRLDPKKILVQHPRKHKNIFKPSSPR